MTIRKGIDEKLEKEKYDRFISDIFVRIMNEVSGMQIMGRKVDMNNAEEIAAAYWLLKNMTFVEDK